MCRRSECCVTAAMSWPSIAIDTAVTVGEAQQQLGQRGLARPRGSDQAHVLPRLDMQVQPLEERRAGAVGEPQVAELHAAVRHRPGRARPGRRRCRASVAAMPANLAQRPMARGHQPDELEGLLQARPDEGGVEEDQVDRAGRRDVAQRQHHAHRDRGPVEEGHGRLHLDPRGREHLVGPAGPRSMRIADQRPHVGTAPALRPPASAPWSGWRWCRR